MVSTHKASSAGDLIGKNVGTSHELPHVEVLAKGKSEVHGLSTRVRRRLQERRHVCTAQGVVLQRYCRVNRLIPLAKKA